MRLRRSLVAVLGAVAAGCGNGVAATPPAPLAPAPAPVDLTAEPTAIPPGAPPPADMQLAAEDPTLSSFDDPTAASTDPNYLSGDWQAQDGTLVQDAQGPSTKLMVRRYVGVQGAGLSDRYRVEVTAWEYHYHGDDPGRDPGVLALIPYWKDANHYAILSASSDSNQLWVNDGHEPGEPWPEVGRLWMAPISPPLELGDAITWDVDVDIPSQRMTVYVDGQRRADVTTPFLTKDPHQVAIAANGDQVRFKGFKLWIGASSPAPSPP